MNSRLKWMAPVLAALALAGCGGGGGGGGGKLNKLPTASFTASPTSGQAPLAVSFNASASTDPDGTITGYAWNFGDNATGSGVTASHTYTTAGTYTATLTVTDNRGGTGQTTRTVTVTSTQPTTVTVSGRITYDRVPFHPCTVNPCTDGTFQGGLDYTNTIEAPARGVAVELVQASTQGVIATATTSATGDYLLTAPANTSVFVRAKAMSVATGTTANPATWDIRVLDNFGGANSQYAIQGATFDTGTTNQTRNLRAASGWSGFAGYIAPRAAAPFAILDTLYSAVQFLVAQGDRSITLSRLNVYWSTENRPTVPFQPSRGWIDTTAYRYGSSAGGAPDGIYVLGDASSGTASDTDEYDQHIVAHEFQHFLEDELGRTDSPGGPHALDERLDLRVAFSEGFANAFSAMVLGDPVYKDSFGSNQTEVFRFNMETGNATLRGWYNETSVHAIAWDLYDGVNDDALAVGFGPMYDVLKTELRDGVPLTSVFAFVSALKTRAGMPVAALDARVQAENIVAATIDPWGSTETNSGVATSQRDLVLPIYSDITLNGPTVRLCGDTVVGTYNKIGNRRFLRFNVPSSRSINIEVTCVQSDSTCAGSPVPDPDLGLYRGRSVEFAESETPYTESLQKSAAAGDYVLEIYEYSHVDPETGAARRGRTCMTVRITG